MLTVLCVMLGAALMIVTMCVSDRLARGRVQAVAMTVPITVPTSVPTMDFAS